MRKMHGQTTLKKIHFVKNGDFFNAEASGRYNEQVLLKWL